MRDFASNLMRNHGWPAGVDVSARHCTSNLNRSPGTGCSPLTEAQLGYLTGAGQPSRAKSASLCGSAVRRRAMKSPGNRSRASIPEGSMQVIGSENTWSMPFTDLEF